MLEDTRSGECYRSTKASPGIPGAVPRLRAFLRDGSWGWGGQRCACLLSQEAGFIASCSSIVRSLQHLVSDSSAVPGPFSAGLPGQRGHASSCLPTRRLRQQMNLSRARHFVAGSKFGLKRKTRPSDPQDLAPSAVVGLLGPVFT